MKRYEFFGLDRSDVFSLRQGECFIFSPGVLGFRAMIRRRFSPHTAHTPGLEHLARHLCRVQPIEYLSRTNYTSVVVAPTIQDTDLLEDEYEPDTEGHAAVPPGPRPRPLSPLLQKALDAYYPGMSYRELGEVLNIGKDKAGDLIKELRRRKLIAEETKDE